MMIIDRDSLVEFVAQKTGNSKTSYDVDVITTGILHSDHPQYGTDWSQFLVNLDLDYYLEIEEHTYHVAVMQQSTGFFDVIKTFEAVDDADANAYAAENHSDLEWYVLDATLKNINDGERVGTVVIHRKKVGKS